MRGKLRGLAAALSALALTATVLVETIPNVAQAKPLASGPIAVAGAVQVAASFPRSTQITSPHGPTCLDPAPTTLKFIVNTNKTVHIQCTKTSIGPSPSPTPTVTPTPIPVPTFTADPAQDPSPTATPTPIVEQSPDVVFVEDITTRPPGVTVSVNSETGEVTITGTIPTEGIITINANQKYAISQPNYEYTGTTKIEIPISIKVERKPTCRTYTVGTVKNGTVEVSLLKSFAGDGGCQEAIGYGPLTFSISDVILGANSQPYVTETSTGLGEIFKFKATGTVSSSQSANGGASFQVVATDAYGQTSLGYDKANVPIKVAGVHVSAAPIFINVSAPRACSNKKAATKTGVVFNDPRNSFASEYQITNNVIRLIDCANPGSFISMSWFSMTDLNFVNHLIQAKKAGVTVRLLLNSHAVQPGSASFTAYSTLKKALETTPADGIKKENSRATGGSGSWVSYCKSGCLTPKAPNGLSFPEGSESEYPALHSKFFMFSRLVNTQSVIGISSINPTYAQAVSGFNSASISVNDGKLFSSMSKYFADLAVSALTSGRTKAKAYRILTSDSKSTIYKAYPLSSGDDIASLLKDVQCIYQENGKTKRTTIYVNMFVFTRNSPAKSLWKLANALPSKGGGCNVQIIYTDMDQRIKAYNSKTKKWAFITSNGKNTSWGVADCLSSPATANGRVGKISGPGLTWDRTLNRYVQGSVCQHGTLNGQVPTVNKIGGYCWIKSKSEISGGSLNVCVSTPLAVTVFDAADGRAKLEAVADSQGKKWYTHQKYIAIEGMYKGEVSNVVISGTPNITSPGIRWNDEIITISNNKSILRAYKNNFEQIKVAILNRALPARDPMALYLRW